MAYLKKDAPADVVETLRQAEAQADECWRALQILQNPSNTVLWALLTGGIRMVEREQTARGSNTPHFDPMLINISRLLAITVKWGIGHGRPVIAPVAMDWTHQVAAVLRFTAPGAERDRQGRARAAVSIAQPA